VTRAVVDLEGADPSGLAELLSGLIRQQLAREPSRAANLRPSVVVLEVPDAAVVVTVRIGSSHVRVLDGSAPDAHLRVVADADRLLALTAAPLRAGMPDPFRPAGRAAITDLLARRVRVHGLLRHPRRLARFTSLVSIDDPGRKRGAP
jgi:hypothetical protein